MFLFSYDKSPEMELLSHVVLLFLIIWGILLLFFIVVVPIYISTSSAQVFIFLHIFSPLLIFCLSVTSHSNRYEEIFHCGFHFNFPMVSDVEYLFMYLLDICYIFFGEMFIQILCPLLIRLFVFLLLNYMSSGYWVLDMSSNYISPL